MVRLCYRQGASLPVSKSSYGSVAASAETCDRRSRRRSALVSLSLLRPKAVSRREREWPRLVVGPQKAVGEVGGPGSTGVRAQSSLTRSRGAGDYSSVSSSYLHSMLYRGLTRRSYLCDLYVVRDIGVLAAEKIPAMPSRKVLVEVAVPTDLSFLSQKIEDDLLQVVEDLGIDDSEGEEAMVIFIKAVVAFPELSLDQKEGREEEDLIT
nr:hypothetical protein HmN_000999000 [Hymenolepis microstoma]